MVEPYDLQEIDNFATIEEFSEPLIDKYSQNFSIQNNFGINLSNKFQNYPIFIFFKGHTKYIETNSYLINDFGLKNEIDNNGLKEIDIDNPIIKNIPILFKYINLYLQSNIIPYKVLISKPISFSLEHFFSEIINENGFISNLVNINSLIDDLNLLEKTKIFNKENLIKSLSNKVPNEIHNGIIYNKEFKYSFIFNSDNKIDIGNWNELEVVYCSDKPIISEMIYEKYDRKFWNNFLISYHSAILDEIETNDCNTIEFKYKLDTIIKNMFITNKETNLENNNTTYSLEDIYLKIRDRLNNDYGFSIYYIMKLIEEFLIDFKQDDGKYKGLIDRYDYQINNNLETDYKERSKLYSTN